VERILVVLAASAFIVAAVLFSAWLPGQFTTPAVDRAGGYVSELAARDQPWTRLFRITDALSGLACVLGVAVTPRARREWPGWLAFAGFGAFTLTEALFPLDCATLSNPFCGYNPLSLSHRLHGVAAVLATAAVLAAMVLLSLSWRTAVSWLVTGMALGATALTLSAAAAGVLVGTVQRAQVTVIAIWFVYVAIRLLISDPDPPGPARPHVVEQGAGPAVLISPGFAGASYHWDLVAAALVASHRVIRFDRPGLGLSPPAPAPLTVYGEAARLAALAPAHPDRVTVVAHSVGAWHAEAFARLHPLRVSGLVLVEPSCANRRKPATSPPGRATGRWLPALGVTWAASALARLFGPALHHLVTGVPPARTGRPAAEPARRTEGPPVDAWDVSRGGRTDGPPVDAWDVSRGSWVDGAPVDAWSVSRSGRVLAAVVGEWLAYHDMAADLRRIRAEHPFPEVPVTVISVGDENICHERLAGLLRAELIRVRVPRVHLTDPGAIAEAV
jgi:pimeloyl-ACP methyl ester carboxylesterase